MCTVLLYIVQKWSLAVSQLFQWCFMQQWEISRENTGGNSNRVSFLTFFRISYHSKSDIKAPKKKMLELTFLRCVLITLIPHQKTGKYHTHNCLRKILESKSTLKNPLHVDQKIMLQKSWLVKKHAICKFQLSEQELR